MKLIQLTVLTSLGMSSLIICISDKLITKVVNMANVMPYIFNFKRKDKPVPYKS